MTEPKANPIAAGAASSAGPLGGPLADEEGYPTETALTRIRAWPWADSRGLLQLVHDLWWAADWGWTETEEDGRPHYAISTAGWSGNEDLIGALQDNTLFWMLCWQSSRRGGHYEFRIPVIEDASKTQKSIP